MYDINNKVILNMSNDISNSTSQYKILFYILITDM